MSLCKECRKRPIMVKKRELCNSCYQKFLGMHGPIFGKPKRKMDAHRQKIRILNRYPGIDSDLQRLNISPFIKLKDIGYKHGVSREYIRLIFPIFIGITYTESHRNSALALHEEMKGIGCIHDPRNKVATYIPNGNIYISAKAELIVFEKCSALGFDVKPCAQRAVDLIVNGFKVDVKSAIIPRKPNYKNPDSYRKYYLVALTKTQKDVLDFVIAYVWVSESFYIIPKSEFKSGTIYIPANSGPHEHLFKLNRIERFKNAWGFLDRMGTSCLVMPIPN